VLLDGYLYAVAAGMVLVPIVIMEICKAIGLIKHHH